MIVGAGLLVGSIHAAEAGISQSEVTLCNQLVAQTNKATSFLHFQDKAGLMMVSDVGGECVINACSYIEHDVPSRVAPGSGLNLFLGESDTRKDRHFSALGVGIRWKNGEASPSRELFDLVEVFFRLNLGHSAAGYGQQPCMQSDVERGRIPCVCKPKENGAVGAAGRAESERDGNADLIAFYPGALAGNERSSSNIRRLLRNRNLAFACFPQPVGRFYEPVGEVRQDASECCDKPIWQVIQKVILPGLLLLSVATLFICDRISDRAVSYALLAYGCLWVGLAWRGSDGPMVASVATRQQQSPRQR